MMLAPISASMADEKQPISGMTCTELTAFYKKLPFTDVLPLDEGPISINGQAKDLTIGFSQTGFNHPWRVSMLEALQAEACRHPNIKLIVLDGNVDVAKQSNDVRDLLARERPILVEEIAQNRSSDDTCRGRGRRSFGESLEVAKYAFGRDVAFDKRTQRRQRGGESVEYPVRPQFGCVRHRHSAS